jgi:GT2 family glycosyltransferase
MNNLKLAVIIPTFNRKEVTQKCVTNLLNGTISNINIIICDSGSSDGTPEAFQNIDNVSVLNVGEDSWWTAAVNAGVSVALQKHFEFVLVLNDDVDIPLNLVEKMLGKAKLNPDKIISPAQKYEGGIFLGIRYLGIFKTSSMILSSNEKMEVEVESSNGCCLLIPSDSFGTIGLFDESHCPHLYGDTEFQIRAWNYGLGTMAFSDIVICQHANTDYFGRLQFKGLLTHKGSPLHFRAYLIFGRTLFRSMYRFAFFGAVHHRLYFRSLIKALYILLRQSLSNKRTKN